MTDTHVPDIQVSNALDGLQRVALIAAVVGLVGLAAGIATNQEQFYRSYLIGYIYWVSVPLGCLALLMVHHLSGGAWGLMVRRTFEAAAATLPIMGILFVPVVLGIDHIYEWSHLDVVAKDPILTHKAPYLNATGFTIRAVFYFVVWSALAMSLIGWSRQQDKVKPAEGADVKFRMVSGPGVLILGLTLTFAAVDWVMSLDPHWYSTIFGLLLLIGTGLTAMSFTVFVMSKLSQHTEMGNVIAPKNIQDWGKLMMAFTMLWAYLAYSQFLIIWSANLPEEIPWYLLRFNNGWGYAALFLAFGHFFLPFFMLLSRHRKQHLNRLVKVAAWVLVARFVDIYWVIAPQFHPDSMLPSWMDLAAVLGIGGIWLTLFVRNIKGQSLLPVNDPYLPEALADGHH
jgi:hypothetical protein